MSFNNPGSAYIAIAGTAKNWAWSLRDYGKNKLLSPSYYDNIAAPLELQSRKEVQSVLWAFTKEADYKRLERILEEYGKAVCLLITNKYNDTDFHRGIIAIGKITKNDLVGKIRWEYWPEKPKKGGSWDFKFFIRIDKLAPSVEDTLASLQALDHSRFDSNLRDILTRWSKDIITLIPSRIVQGSLFELDKKEYEMFSILVRTYWSYPTGKIRTYNRCAYEDLSKVIAIHLMAGKNVIIYGPPGGGKTILAKHLSTKFCGSNGYMLMTGNPEWSAYEVVGGPVFTKERMLYRLGFLSEAIVRCWRNLKTSNKPYWLIIDEINRADADKAFGKAFTLLDVVHRQDIPLIADNELSDNLREELRDFLVNGELYMPYSFRVIATMNSYDRTLLFKLGYALLRRFALIPMLKKYNLSRKQGNNVDIVQLIKEPTNEEIDKELIVYELGLSRNIDTSVDCATIKPELYVKISPDGFKEFEESTKGIFGFSPVDIIEWLRGSINKALEGTEVEVAVASASDAVKFLWVSYLYLKKDEFIERFFGLLDEAVAAYMMPQLDVLVEKVWAGKVYGSKDDITSKLREIRGLLESLSLSPRSIGHIDKILRGERII